MTREEAKTVLVRMLYSSQKIFGENNDKETQDALKMAIEALKEPKEGELTLEKAIDFLTEIGWLYNHDKELTKERPYGEWIVINKYKKKGKNFLDCSNCHYGENGEVICEVSKTPSFCPNCGAIMRKEDNKNET